MAHSVAPLAGAWIEIVGENLKLLKGDVAPLAGAWIEMITKDCAYKVSESLPSRERGLKYLSYIGLCLFGRRSPRGSVD